MNAGVMMGERRAGPLQVMRTVLSALFGVRHRRMHEEDAAGLRPGQVIVAGIIVVAAFVLAIVAFVQFVAIK
ncbi:MAG: hypothetical protein BroJett006_05510 [Betaproteobacteria bacterium]|nr:MAG: hypothetical protein BroJett006_05510 [Betaproteobacteria bacterium]